MCEADTWKMMQGSPRFVEDGKMLIYNNQHFGHIRETHRHHEGRERKWEGSNSLIQFSTVLWQYVWFFYLISCHGHVCHHFCLQDNNDDKQAKEMHPDRVTQTATWMFIVIVLTHKCMFLSAECSRHNLIATYVSCKIQDKSSYFFFFCSKLSPQAKWSSTKCFHIKKGM